MKEVKKGILEGPVQVEDVGAYKQIPLSDEAYERDALLAVCVPATQEAIFKQRVLPLAR